MNFTMKKLFTPFLLIFTLGSFAQQVNSPNTDFEKFRVPQEEFEALKSLHAHVKKHNMFLGDYYVKYYGRKNKLTGELLPRFG